MLDIFNKKKVKELEEKNKFLENKQKEVINKFAAHIANLEKLADKKYYIENDKEGADFTLNEVFALKHMAEILGICNSVYKEAYKIYDFRKSGKKDFVLTKEKREELENFIFYFNI